MNIVETKQDLWIQEDPLTNEVTIKPAKTTFYFQNILNLTSSIALNSLKGFDPRGRLLLLDGEKGTVACRVCNETAHTIPRVSDDWTLEFATRSFLRMSNLIAVRGIPGASMVGPCDYFGNLGQLDLFLYNIDVTVFPPIIQRKPYLKQKCVSSSKFNDAYVTTVRANWISGDKKTIMQEKQSEYHLKPQNLRQSLFLNPGLLELETSVINLKYFDPRGVDLSSFKARLVDNTIPFQISNKPLASKDDYRVVTYRYEEGYAEWQIKEGSGLFLEKHNFSQIISPLTADSKGFVTLARLNDNNNELEMIGIQIPFGYSIIIEEGCIHGDTTLNGFYMMGMTSDHTTMGTADTVFLKDQGSKENVRMILSEQEDLPSTEKSVPYVLFSDASEKDRSEFIKLIKDRSLIFTPFCSEYWRILSGR